MEFRIGINLGDVIEEGERSRASSIWSSTIRRPGLYGWHFPQRCSRWPTRSST